MSPEIRQAWLTAGDWVIANWPNLAIAAGLGAFAWWSIRRGLRDRHHLPAAFDNVEPTDSDALTTCRRIHRLGVRDPHIQRHINNCLRQKGDEQP